MTIRPADDAPVVIPAVPVDAEEPIGRLLYELKTSRHGLSGREASRRLTVFGPNELRRRRGPRLWRELVVQLTHPLALLLWLAAGLSLLTAAATLAWAIVAVILLNAGFALAQERQAQRAVEALSRYLPPSAEVVRDGAQREVPAATIVPGDVLVVSEGERICADARLIAGIVDVDMSPLTGESLPVTRSPEHQAGVVPHLQASTMVFSGTTCTSGQATAVVVATGDHTELGRIAALSHKVTREQSPLERQVKRAAWLIAAVAIGVGFAFLPLGMLAGLPLTDAAVFAVGLLVANVPEGLLPTITLALAVGVRALAREGALVKRLSAVETLGSTTVICTDKTGTLTENRMTVIRLWTPDAELSLPRPDHADIPPALLELAGALAACTTASPDGVASGRADATEVALLEAAAALGLPADPALRDSSRRALFRFDPGLKRMAVVESSGAVDVKGAPESVLPLCDSMQVDGRDEPLTRDWRDRVDRIVAAYANEGLRLLTAAKRSLEPGEPTTDRRAIERGLTLLGLVALYDPPRPEVIEAIARCHTAGLRVHVVTGDHGLTAGHIAAQVGIGREGTRVVTGAELDAMPERSLDELLCSGDELVFARSSPEAKLRIADALRDLGAVVAMTGDGVNDAPALRRADIGVAMGRSGTDVAREASTMVLTDDDFATIVTAIEAGRRVYDNVRKFITYIFAHAVPEVVPFLVFALSGGAVPLPLTVLQILAIDLGTETLPALALGREPAEPGIMSRPPRPRTEGVIRPDMLFRAWAFLGGISTVLVLGGFFFVLVRAGWSPGAATESGTPLHHAYVEATTATFAGIVACQLGTALACRTETASLRQMGLLSNPLLLAGMAFEVAFAAALIYLPPLQHLFGVTALDPVVLAFLAPFPVIVWGADELRRRRRRVRAAQARKGAGPNSATNEG